VQTRLAAGLCCTYSQEIEQRGLCIGEAAPSRCREFDIERCAPGNSRLSAKTMDKGWEVLFCMPAGGWDFLYDRCARMQWYRSPPRKRAALTRQHSRVYAAGSSRACRPGQL